MGGKRGPGRRGPSLAVLPLALLVTLIALSQRKWIAGGISSRLPQLDQNLGAAFARAAVEWQTAQAADQSGAATDEAPAAPEATAAAVDASPAEVAPATQASAGAHESAAQAAALAEGDVEAARADATDEASAAAAASASLPAAAATADDNDGDDDTGDTPVAADAWQPEEAGVDADGAAAGTAGDAVAAGEHPLAVREGLEAKAAALAAELDSAAHNTSATGAAATEVQDAAAEAAAVAAEGAGHHGGVAATDGRAEAAPQLERSLPAAASQQLPCALSGQPPAEPSPAEALNSLLARTHEYFLSEDDVRRGVAFRGTGARAQAVAAKLLAGQPVHVAVVGGSVTWGQGAIYGGSFGARFFNWLNATWPSLDHRFTNAAKPAVTSSLYAICGGSMVPQDADIIVLEFAFNDNYAGISLLSPPRVAYEQLIRRMLNFPSSPLVVSMHFFGYWIAKPKLRGPAPPLFYATGEDDLAVIAQHYDVPVLSVRNAALHHMEKGDPGFKVDVMDPHQLEGANLTDYFYYDDHHPFDLTGHRAMADLLVAVVQDAARHVVRQQAGQQMGQQQAQQVQQQAGQAEQVGQQMGQQQQAQQVQQQAGQAQHVRQQVPDPMFPGNWESPNPTCRLGASFKDTVVQSKGFEWRPQNPNATQADAQKWAWQGNAPGAWVLLRLNTDLGQPASKAANARVILGHVCSWRDLGSARLECVSGCTCPTLRLEHRWKHKSTQTALVAFEVSQHERCEIRVTVAKPAGPEAATILNAVMVDRADGAGLEMGNVGQWDMMGSVGA